MEMMEKIDIKSELERYTPIGDAEISDKRIMLECIEKYPDIFTRECDIAHFTASAWVVNEERTHVLMAYHKIFDEWAWTGGHADGERDLLSVAMREVEEETGVSTLSLLSDGIASIQIIPVLAHYRRGVFVSSHLHLDVCYLFEAPSSSALRANDEENTGVKWVPIELAPSQAKEKIIIDTYKKLNSRIFFPSSF